MKKKYFIFVPFLVLMFIFSGCVSSNQEKNTENDSEAKSNNSSDSEFTIGVSAIDLTNPFFIQLKEAGEEAGEDYDVETIWQSADNSVEEQVSDIEDFVEQGVDAILIDPADKESVIPAIEQAEENNIEVLTMGNKVEGDWNYNTLYPDYDNMGMVADVFGTALDGEGKIAYLSLSPGNYVSDEREEGFMDTIEEEYPDIEVIGNQPTDFDTAEAQKITETWLKNNDDLDGIAFAHDPLGVAAMSVAETMDRDDIIFGGYDGELEMAPYIEDGRMLIDNLTGSYRIGYWNVAMAARILDGSDFPKDLEMPTHFITSDETAEMLSEKDLEFEYVTPEEEKEVFEDYKNEFGPDIEDEKMSEK